MEEIELNKFSSLGFIHATINGLKNINELYGDQYGDDILKQVAKVLDDEIVGELFRLSGDEFIAICKNISKSNFDKIISNLREKSRKSKEFSFSVGGIWQDRKLDIRQGLSQAGEIMYAEKQNYYKEKRTGIVQTRANAVEILLNEIRSGVFSVYLQPKVVLSTGKIDGAEALIRKTGESGKLIPPDRFIPIYENEGTIGHIDFFVLDEVCALLQELIKKGKPLKIALNFSRVTFISYDLVEEIVKSCAKYNVPHKYIKIEITESIDKMDYDFFNRKLKDIKANGFDVALDDFGAKYSNLLMLTDTEFSEVKIDKSLIDNLTVSNQNRIVVRNIIKTIKELGTSKCLAEGIEYVEQKNMLLEFGCVYGQGYYFYQPMPISEFLIAYNKCLNTPAIELRPIKYDEFKNFHVSKEAISAIVEAMPLCMTLWNSDYQNLLCNKHALDLLKLPNADVFRKNFTKLFPKKQPDGRNSKDAGFAFMEEALNNGFAKFYWLFSLPKGEEIPCEIRLYKLDIVDENGKALIVAYTKDLRPELAINDEIQRSNDYFFNEVSDKTLFNTIAELSAEWFWVYNNKTAKIQFFGKGREILGLPTDKLPFPDSIINSNMVYKSDIETFLEFDEAMRNGIIKPTEVRFVLPNGKVRHYNIVYKVIFDHHNNPIFCIGKTYDIEEQTSLKIVSQKDLLTDSYNKITTENIIKDVIEDFAHLHHVVFIIDIDDFKGINDKLGHHFGDLVLTSIGKNLQACFREGDVIGRIGGDEFVVFVQNIFDVEAIKGKAKAIIKSFENCEIEGYGHHSISGSVGIAMFPEDGDCYEELYKNADKALYNSKMKGKNCYSFYREDVEE